MPKPAMVLDDLVDRLKHDLYEARQTVIDLLPEEAQHAIYS